MIVYRSHYIRHLHIYMYNFQAQFDYCSRVAQWIAGSQHRVPLFAYSQLYKVWLKNTCLFAPLWILLFHSSSFHRSIRYHNPNFAKFSVRSKISDDSKLLIIVHIYLVYCASMSFCIFTVLALAHSLVSVRSWAQTKIVIVCIDFRWLRHFFPWTLRFGMCKTCSKCCLPKRRGALAVCIVK